MKAAELLGISDLRTTEVEVPKWGTTLTVRELTLDEGVKLSQMYRHMDGEKASLKAEDIAQVVAWGVVDNGERVFSDDDVPRLAQKNRDVLLALYTTIVGLSGDPEEAEKN